MSDIKAGTVAFVKITGEPTFVLSIVERASSHYTGEYEKKEGRDDFERPIYQVVSGPTAICRTASIGNSGTHYNVKSFTLPELETIEEQKKRFIAEREELRAHFTNQNGASTPTADLGFSNN